SEWTHIPLASHRCRRRPLMSHVEQTVSGHTSRWPLTGVEGGLSLAPECSIEKDWTYIPLASHQFRRRPLAAAPECRTDTEWTHIPLASHRFRRRPLMSHVE
ncbi:hypothetical protein NDU88_007500, partial [Pleurodeles waltl]